MKIISKLIFCILLTIICSSKIIAKNIWVLDSELSEINFKLPIFLAEDVNGNFTEFEGLIVIDQENNENNRAFFFTKINNIDLNYDKYKELLFSNLFFDIVNYPISIIDTKKFKVLQNENVIQINVDLQIKNITQRIPANIEIIYLSNTMIQLKVDLVFSRTTFELGKGKWSPTMFLRDKIQLNANIFLKKT